MDNDTGEMGGGITEDHYLGYLAIIGFMGLVRCRAMEWHWSTGKRMHHFFVRRIMPYKFFLLMRRFLHFNDSEKKVPRGDRALDPPADYDQIYNFRPIMNACNGAWILLVSIVSNLAYDEQMVKCAMHTKLSRRQPNKPIRDGFQIFALCAASGCWMYCGWIDQGKLDPDLRPPYPYGWHAAVLLHLVGMLNLSNMWVTIAMDQAFPSPRLFTVLYLLGVYAVGTIQQNRIGFPSLQFAAWHKAQAGGYKAFKVVGTAVHKVHTFIIKHNGKPRNVRIYVCQWFDKNLVNIISNKHGDVMKHYEHRSKGTVDSVDSEQPEAREEYNETNNGAHARD